MMLAHATMAPAHANGFEMTSECFFPLSGFETSVVYMLLYIRVACCFMDMRVGPDCI